MAGKVTRHDSIIFFYVELCEISISSVQIQCPSHMPGSVEHANAALSTYNSETCEKHKIQRKSNCKG